MGLFFAVPIWKLRLTTLGDFFKKRFSHHVERTAVMLMIPTSLLWAAAQIRAFGQVLSASSGFEVSLMITAAAGIVVLYTVFGGLLADAWTDLIQGISLMIGLVVLMIAVIGRHGAEIYSTVPEEKLALFGGGELSLLDNLEAWAIPVLGSLMAAELLTRAMAARSPEVAQRSAFMAGGLYLAMGMIPVSIGLLGFALMPGLQEPEQLLPLMAQDYLPPMLYAMFAGALVSAILSTVDSALLVSASLLSHNIVVPLSSNLSEKQKVYVARCCVVLFGIIAYVMALYADGVYALVEEASAFGSAGIFIVIVFGLFTRWGGWMTAMASLVVGVVVWIVAAYWLAIDYPYLTSLASSALAYLGVAGWEFWQNNRTGRPVSTAVR
jgi:Na+/proline symporter